MLTLLFAGLFAGPMSVLWGLLFWPFTAQATPGFQRVVVCLLGGFFTMLCLANWPAAFVGSHLYAWPLVFVSGAMIWLFRKSLRDYSQAWVAVLRSPRGALWLGASGLVWVLLMMPGIRAGEPVLYEAGANHDSLFWVTVADVLQSQGYLERTAPMQGTPTIYYLYHQFAGWWGWDTRTGGEVLLSVASELCGVRPMYLYNSLAAALYFFWLGLCLGFMRPVSAWRDLGVACIGLPLFLFYHAFGSYPNLLGVLLTAGIILGQLYPLSGRARWVYTGLGFSALLACYPELLPFAAFALGIVALAQAWAERSARAVLATVVAGAMALCLNPMVTVRGLGVVWNKYLGASDQSSLPRLFSELEWHQVLPALTTLSFPTIRDLALVPGIAFSAALVVLLILACRPSNLPRQVLLGSWISFGLLLAYSASKDFAYGYQKAVQYHGLFIVVALAVGWQQLLPADGKGWWARTRWLMALAVLGFFGYTALVQYRSMMAVAEYKSLAERRDRLPEMRARLEHGAARVLDYSFREPFFFGAWLPYALGANRVHLPSNEDAHHWAYVYQGSEQAAATPYLIVGNGLARGPMDCLSAIEVEGRCLVMLQNPMNNLRLQGLTSPGGRYMRMRDQLELEPELAPMRVTFTARNLGGQPLDLEFVAGERLARQTVLPGQAFQSSVLPVAAGEIYHCRQLRGDSLALSIHQLALLPIARAEGMTGLVGLYDWEGRHCWTTDSMGFSHEQKRSWLNLDIREKYRGIPETKLYLEITDHGAGRSHRLPLQFPLRVSVPLAGPGEVRLQLSSPAVRPSDWESGNTDTRTLGLALRHYSVTPEPLYPTSGD